MKSPTLLAVLAASVLVLVAVGNVPASDAPTTRPAAVKEPAATQPAATQPVGPKVPSKVIKNIEARFNLAPPRPTSRAEYVRRMAPRMLAVLKLGQEAEKKYPDAVDLHVVRGAMLRATGWLAGYKKEDRYVKQMHAIASRLVASNAPSKEKTEPDYLLTRSKIAAGQMSAEKIDKQIRALAGRYEKTDAAGRGVYFATVLAVQTRRRQLAREFADTLETKHLDEPGARSLLRQLGRHPDVGRPFKATLTKLDGTKLNLPEDLNGKVVVIDFWSTGCPPCIGEIPHMKRLYARYRNKGVEFVGISLDTSRRKLTELVTNREMGWVHAFTGKGGGDPTAQRYEIRAIPSIWVIGKDGKVVSDDARRFLEAVIQRALKAPAPKPPATRPAPPK